MTNPETAKRLPGLATGFKKVVADPPAPTPEQLAKVASIGATLGFVTQDLQAGSLAPGGGALSHSTGAPVPTPPAPAKPKSDYADRLNMRVSTKDRMRFEDFAHRHRLSNGAALTLIMDYAERMEELLKSRGGD
jgi:hypothetical protein